MIRDYGTVLERVNASSAPSSRPRSSKGVKSVFDHIDEVLRQARRQAGREVITHPSAIKAGLKDALKKELEAPEVRKLIARAEAVYESLRPMEGRVLWMPAHEVFYAAIDQRTAWNELSLRHLRNSEYAQPDDRCA